MTSKAVTEDIPRRRVRRKEPMKIKERWYVMHQLCRMELRLHRLKGLVLMTGECNAMRKVTASEMAIKCFSEVIGK